MSEPQNPMPKPELKNVPPPQSADGGGMPQDASAFFAPALRTDAEQFPVLKAFQSYLEEERERARRRVVIVSASAIAAIVVIVIVFLVIGSIVVGNLMSRNDQLLAAVISSAAPGAAVAIAPVTPAEKGKPTAEESALNEKIAQLEKANSALTRQMEGLQTLPDVLAGRMDAVVSNAMALAAAKPATPVPAAQPTVRVSTPPAAPAPGPVEVAEVKPLPGETAAPPPPAPVAEVTPKVEVIQVKPRADAKPMVEGFRSESIVLSTDAGIRIPWRIAVEQ